MLISPQRIRSLSMAKALIVPAVWLAMLMWAMVRVPPPRRAVRAARDCARRGHVLGMAERAEQHAGHLRHPRHEHRRLAVSCVFVVQFVLLADAH